jgi:hypothetical protein
MHVHELALRLMVVLYKGHLNESQPTTNQQSSGISSADDIAYIISLASNYSKSQMMLSEYLTRRRPDLTMAMFSGKIKSSNYSIKKLCLSRRNHNKNFNSKFKFTRNFIYDFITMDA